MKKAFLLCMLCMAFLSSRAQNLVPNPSFEEYKKLDGLCQYLNIPDNTYLEDFVKNWFSPTNATPDYWRTDIPSNCNLNIVDKLNSLPKTGNATGGIITYSQNGTIINKSREYLENKLSQKLTIGKSYHVRFYALNRQKQSGWVSNNLGAYFSDTLVDWRYKQDFYYNLPFAPQVVEKKVLMGTNWHEVSGCFQSKSPAEYIIIGNFADNENTIAIREPNTLNLGPAYYLIDDVSVEELSYQAPAPDLGRDTTLCVGETLLLSAGSGASYIWQDGSSSPTYLVREAGKYWVRAKLGVCVASDTIEVKYDVPVSLPADTNLCEGESLTLRARHWRNSYKWQDGSTADTLVVDRTGIYWVQVPTARCVVGDTIRVEFEACPSFVPNVFTPNGDGKNDRFEIGNILSRRWRFVVYNRWGGEVYRSEAYQNDWDGRGLPAGVYYYELSNPALRRRFKGWISLMR
ncbi:MAG: gliding motility-associated C-terminal domain-containing protein [Bacteroidetes bacterium]|nr:MAG: gliding motility-associated C-terminal domain-containing protein [Bacteroidota bacterium]